MAKEDSVEDRIVALESAQARKLTWVGTQIDGLQHDLEKATNRLDALRQSIFNEVGRLTYHLENYDMADSTRKAHAATIHVLRGLLQADDELA